MLRSAPAPLCNCGHNEDAHDHYRPGTDCGRCGPSICAAYQAAGQGWWARLLRRQRR